MLQTSQNVTTKNGFEGRMYWSRGQVRVWLKDGRMIDLGPKSLSSAKAVARRYRLNLVMWTKETQ